jgi:hypothetical protein
MSGFWGVHDSFLFSPVLPFYGVSLMKQNRFSIKKVAMLVVASTLALGAGSAFAANAGVAANYPYGGGFTVPLIKKSGCYSFGEYSGRISSINVHAGS